MVRITIEVGVLARREVRRLLQREGVPYTEDKGLLDSQFVATTDRATVNRIRAQIAHLENRL